MMTEGRAPFLDRSYHVRPVLVSLPRSTRAASSDAQLPTGQSDYYSLSTMERYEVHPYEMRRAIVDAIGTPFVIAREPMPCISPVLVASLKPCFLPEARNYARVAFDLDCEANVSADTEFPAPEDLASIVLGWAEEWLVPENDDGHFDLSKERCVLLMGAFGDKWCSAHIIFCDLVWLPDRSNLLKNNLRALAQLDEALAVYGMKVDPSITTSGLKLPFCNKRLKDGSFRNAVQVLAGTWNVDDAALTFGDIYDMCDGVVPVDDPCARHKVSIKPSEPQARRQRAEGVAVIAQAETVVAGETAQQRLGAAVPLWNGCTIKTIVKPGGSSVLIPQTNSCPFKTMPTDTPAFEHGSPGKAYAVSFPDGSLRVRCHICSGREIIVRSDRVANEHDDTLLEWFNQRFCKLNSDKVLEYGVELVDGSISEDRVLSHKHFHAQLLHLPKLKVGKKMMAQSQLWLESSGATMYRLGLICDPTQTCDGRFFNTYKGFDRRVLKLAKSMSELSDEQLLLECDHFIRLVRHNICADHEESLRYVLFWIASMLQRPGEKCRTALVVTGAPGCGKGLAAQYLLTIVGKPHGMQVDSRSLTDHWNHAIADAVFLFCDEAVRPSDEAATSMMKMLITEDTMTKRQRYRDDVTGQRNFCHLMLASNFPDSVDWQKGERRFVAMGADYRLFRDHTPEWSTFINGCVEEREALRGPAALYTYCMRLNLDEWNPQDIPVTPEHWRTHYESMTLMSKFVYRFLCTGDVMEGYNVDQPRDLAIAQAVMERNGFAPDDEGNRAWDIGDMGVNVFARTHALHRHEHAVFPKRLMVEGLKQHFPDCGRNPEAALWRYLYQLAPQEDWAPSRLNLAGNKVQIFRFPERDTLRHGFLRVEGERDLRIFDEWRVN